MELAPNTWDLQAPPPQSSMPPTVSTAKTPTPASQQRQTMTSNAIGLRTLQENISPNPSIVQGNTSAQRITSP